MDDTDSRNDLLLASGLLLAGAGITLALTSLKGRKHHGRTPDYTHHVPTLVFRDPRTGSELSSVGVGDTITAAISMPETAEVGIAAFAFSKTGGSATFKPLQPGDILFDNMNLPGATATKKFNSGSSTHSVTITSALRSGDVLILLLYRTDGQGAGGDEIPIS